ncbi:unnamed protein product [Pelagomonas calceolata]|uniref:Uncharacterized protein n=1 Tax=Pelagomonas calceolata TaxID=35677 RepID=A0A8J2SES8_9STRA|nr:unnamed protein product [Pelagomonas calceolata]
MPLCAAPVPHGCERARNSAPGQPKAAPRARTPATNRAPRSPPATKTAPRAPQAPRAPATNRAPRKPPVTNNTKSLAAYARDSHCELLILPIVLAHVLFLRRRRRRGAAKAQDSELAYPLPVEDTKPRARPRPCTTSPPAPQRKKLWDGGPTTAAVHDAAAAQAGRDAKSGQEATERQRAVAESENEFLREFEALLRGGLDVDVRPSDEWRKANGSRATVEHALLSLGTDTRGRARCAWTVAERDTAFLVAEMRCVARPLPAELGELSARSFIVQHDGDATLVHCPSEDLADLCVAGFNLLADREVEKARANAWKKGKTPSAKKALGDSN